MSLYPTGNAQDLREYQWRNRLVILVDHTLYTQELQSQYQLLIREEAKLKERDIILISLSPSEVHTTSNKSDDLEANAIYKALSLPKHYSGLLLIGKDGGVKLKKNFEVLPELIFTRIDGMPMRRAEMRNNRNKP